MNKLLKTKLITLLIIAIVLLIPLTMIASKVSEREYFSAQAKQNISESWTSRQTLAPAVIVLPYYVYKEVKQEASNTPLQGIKLRKTLYKKLIIPQQLEVQTSLKNDIKEQGIYQVPVYTATMKVSGSLDNQRIKESMRTIEEQFGTVDFKSPYFSVFMSDVRGINSAPLFTFNQHKVAFRPGSQYSPTFAGIHAPLTLPDDNNTHEFSYQLEFRGTEALAFIPSALDARFSLSSDWPHPDFKGAFLPLDHTISSDGYQATWAVSSIASNVEELVSKCQSQCDSLLDTTIGVKHIEPVNIYVQTERSVKYGILFILLSFITFFILEILMKLSIHPIQYTLVGLGNAIFYLLLLALSEHIQFYMAYGISTLCCVGLILMYIKPLLHKKYFAIIFSLSLALLYGVLYVIINLEDLAMMMGAIAVFCALGMVMFVTRNVDWYELGDEVTARAVLLSEEMKAND